MSKDHSERKHSKYSASGSDRWFECQGSVALSEGLPDKDSIWSIEGTKAHEVLEQIFLAARALKATRMGHVSFPRTVPLEMVQHGLNAANFILNLHEKNEASELLIETRISLPFIHPEMFGTFDGAVVDHFGTLHVFDYKYGAGHAVSPGSVKKPNLQMVFYGLGLAYRYNWNFKKVRLWIVQPRIKGYDGPVFLEMSIAELKSYVKVFTQAVEKVEKNPKQFAEGSWCHWCKAKAVCPLKQGAKLEKTRAAFLMNPIK